jgi:methylthioribose-1-phosphate isomerase
LKKLPVTVKTLEWKNDRVVMLDQRVLPAKEIYRVYRNYKEVAQAIRAMVVRGAPAIGVAAAMGVALGALKSEDKNFDREFERMLKVFAATRPTAVNLFWALERMRRVYSGNRSAGVKAVRQRLKEEAQRIYADDIAANRLLGKNGARLVGNAARVLTHCNAGALATAGYGTALGVVRALKESGKKVEVFANETRPFLQGARLTAWELKKEGIPVTLMTDSSMGYVLQKSKVDVVIVGCDRVAANGDVANKIGTYTLAVLARRHGIPFYVAGPISSFDVTCPSGSEIPIEERDPKEVSHLFGKLVSPPGVRVLNPAFDVTPNELVSAFITEKGVITPPYKQNIRAHVHH